MTRDAAIRKVAEGLYELADALFAESAVGEAAAPATAPPSAFDDPDRPGPPTSRLEAWEEVAAEILPDQGSEAMCPKHRIPFTEGTYGAYCRSQTDDPAWGKAKGDKLWCRITPKSAAEWLRQRAAA